MNFRDASRFPLIQAFALMAWNHETNPWCAVERVGDGYLAQEAWKLRNKK